MLMPRRFDPVAGIGRSVPASVDRQHPQQRAITNREETRKWIRRGRIRGVRPHRAARRHRRRRHLDCCCHRRHRQSHQTPPRVRHARRRWTRRVRRSRRTTPPNASAYRRPPSPPWRRRTISRFRAASRTLGAHYQDAATSPKWVITLGAGGVLTTAGLTRRTAG